MPKKSFGRRPRRRNGGGRGIPSLSALTQRVVRVPFRGIPYNITQASSGTGGFSSVASLSSVTAANTVLIDPFSIGGRFADVAICFTRWRIRSIKAEYVPAYTTASGVVDLPGGASATANYISRPFVWGLISDPAFNAGTYYAMVEAGGVTGNTSRYSQCVARVRDPRWYFGTSTAASPTAIDQRMIAPFMLVWRFQSSSTTTTATYGNVILSFEAEFCGPALETAQVGLTSSDINITQSQSQPTPPKEEQKSKSVWF